MGNGNENSSSFMKVVRDLLPILILAGVGWVGLNVSDNSSDIKVLSNEIGNLKTLVGAATSDLFTGANAKAAFDVRDTLIEGLGDRMVYLERRVK